ncbi:MAG: hypothetical protein ACK56I_26260, partial [bacterium]
DRRKHSGRHPGQAEHDRRDVLCRPVAHSLARRDQDDWTPAVYARVQAAAASAGEAPTAGLSAPGPHPHRLLRDGDRHQHGRGQSRQGLP